jgi:hypothetical protein
MIPAGLALAAYGVSLILGLDAISIGKFSAGSVDSWAAFIVVLLGIAIAFYGLFGSAIASQKKN